MRHSFAVALGGLALLAGQAVAQERTPAKPAQAPRAVGAQAAQNSQLNDKQELGQHIAACLLIKNEEEIAVSQLGDQAQNDKVKEFAQMMVKEHTKMVSTLQKYTPQLSANETSVRSDREAVPAERNPGTAPAAKSNQATRRGEGAAAANATASTKSISEHLITIERDTAKECLEMTKKELSDKKGEEFDKCFMGMQLAAHQSMLAKLNALDGKVSGDLGQVIDEAKKSTEEHLDHAKKIMEEIAKK